jgi:hypothetical protein
MNPAIIRRSVVFPHPDGPSRKNNSPGWISSETASTAGAAAPGKLLVSDEIEIEVGMGGRELPDKEERDYQT